MASDKCLFSRVPIKIAEQKQTHDVTQPIAAFPLKKQNKTRLPANSRQKSWDLVLSKVLQQGNLAVPRAEFHAKIKIKCNVVSTSATSSPLEVSAKKSWKQLSVSPYGEIKERSSPTASCHIFIAVLRTE